jgi:hypothetical protein
MAGYIERKAGEIDHDAIPQRLAAIALEMLTLQSEKNRLERILFEPPTPSP